MTLNDIKNSSGYRTIEAYSQHVTSMSSIGGLGVYEENGSYYKDFYIAYHNTNTCLKVKMVITPDTTGYTVTSGYITLSSDTTEMLITNAKVMGMIPTSTDNCSEMLNDWYTAINNDTALHDGLLNIYGQTETVPLWYSIADDYLHVDSDYLDLIYNYLYNQYGSSGGTSKPYKYNTATFESGTYTIPNEYHDKVDIIVSGLKDNNILQENSGLNAKQTYELLNTMFSSETPESELIKNSSAIRIIYKASSVGHYKIYVCGQTVTNPVIVNNDGTITATVTKVVVATKDDTSDWEYSVKVLDRGYTATYSSDVTKSHYNCDIYGLDNYSQTILHQGIVDQIFFTGNLAPYTPVGTTPNSNPRTTTYPTWVDTDPLPDPDPVPPTETPTPLPIVQPDPYRIIKPIPPTREPDPTLEDETSDVETHESDPPDNDKVLGNIYDLGTDGTKLSDLADQLYDPTAVERITQVWKNNPNESIISLHYMYIQPDTQSGAIVKLGNFNTNINASYVTSRYKMFECGERAIERKFKNAMDYQTNISLYLPFSGIHQLDVNEVMNSKIKIKGCVDVISGDILYSILVNRKNSKNDYVYDNKCLYTFTGNCKVDIPFSSSSLNSGMVSGIGGVLSSIVTKNPIGALTGTVSTAMNSSTNISHGGSLSGNTGAMGYKYPYLIIEYPKVVDVSLRGKLFGYASNKTVSVNQLNGYNEFDRVHVDTISCSDEDRQEIESILKSGIII